MEKTIVCAILAGYAVLVDLQASLLRSSASSIHDFQVLPLLIWAAFVSVLALVTLFAAFRSEIAMLRKALRAKRSPSKRS